MHIRSSSMFALPLALAALTHAALAQGHGEGHGNANGHEKDRGGASAAAHARGDVQIMPPQARGNPQSQRGQDRRVYEQQRQQARANVRIDRVAPPRADARAEIDNGGDVTIARPRIVYYRPLVITRVQPVVRRYVISTAPREHIEGSALAYAFARGLPQRSLVIVPVGSRLAVRNQTGATLLDLDDNDAMRVGAFRVVPVTTPLRPNAPAFCRSGAGHPVWGRQWCLDKGFGLGAYNNVRWGSVVQPNYVVLQQQPTSANLTTTLVASVLQSLLGTTTFNRLALHALTLGYSEPLTGRWIGQPTGPRTLLVNSGTYPVAELVDTDGDGRADNMLVALRPW